MQDNVDIINSNTDRIDDAVEKLDSLQGVIQKAEDRIDEVNSKRDEIEKIYDRIQEISSDADKQLEMLHDVVRATSAKKVSSQNSDLTPNQRDRVIELRRKGWKADEIASTLGLTENEVKLMIELGNSDGGMSGRDDEELPRRRRSR